MRCRTAILTAALTLTLAAGAQARDKRVDAPHLRSLNEASTAVMRDAQQKSTTVRDLVSQLEASNLVAYVHVAPGAQDTPESALKFIGRSKAQRFVLISISSDASADRRIELLGHELQHAAEAAGTSWVTDDAQFQSLMTMIGWRDSSRARGYETSAANHAQRRVRTDVRAATGTPQ